MNKHLISLLVFLFSIYGMAQSIHLKNQYGSKIYFVDGQTLRANDRFGNAILFYSDNTIKLQDKYGRELFFLDNQTLKIKNRFGQPLLYFEGNFVKAESKYGEKLYYLDGKILKRTNQYGDPIYYFGEVPERWVLASVILHL